MTRFVIGLTAFQAAFLAAVFAAADRVDGVTRHSSSRGSMEAKIEYCKTVTGCPDRVIMAISSCRASRDKIQSTLRINYALSSRARGRKISS